MSGRDKKQIRGGYIDLQRKGVGVGEEETIIFSFSRSALALALARLLRSRARRSFRRERKEKQNNVCVQAMSRSNSPVLYLRLNLLSRSLLLWRGRDKVKKLGKKHFRFFKRLSAP